MAKKDNRSEYNCEPCGGDGLVNNELCLSCSGTGKSMDVSVEDLGTYPPGTNVLTKHGTYVAGEDGVLSKVEE